MDRESIVSTRAAAPGRHHTQQGAEQGGDADDEQRPEEPGAGAVEQPGQDVPARLVRAEEMVAGGADETRRQVERLGVVGARTGASRATRTSRTSTATETAKSGPWPNRRRTRSPGLRYGGAEVVEVMRSLPRGRDGGR
ncbi:hypothetical protein STANM309S_04495 [Streptomyces tanashiensis]